MNLETCLLTSFIRNNDVVSCCDFIPEQYNKGEIIYEVIRVISGKPLYYKEHIERFFDSVKNSGYKISLSKKSLSLRIKALIEINKLIDGNIKFQFSFNDDNQEIFSAWVCPFFYPNNELYNTGIFVKTTYSQRNNPNIKASNLELSKKVNSIISNNNIYEVLLVNKNDLITEGSKSNIFFVIDNNIYTPKVSLVLPGVTRQKVIESSQNISIKCYETEIDINSISKYQGAFITGTSPKVLPVQVINNTNFDPLHPTIKKIMTEYDRVVNKDIQSFLW